MKYFQYYNRQVSTLEYLISLKHKKINAQPKAKPKPQPQPVVVNSVRNTCTQ